MPAGPRHVWVDGRIQPVDVPHLSAFDRGFQLGDGVFETLRARDGRPDRAGRACRPPPAVGGGPGHPPARRHRGAADRRRRRAAGASRGLAGPGGDASIRITVSRGPIVARGLLPHGEQPAPTLVVQAWPVTAAAARPPASVACTSITSAVRRDPENPLAALKTISRADFVYARVEAREAGADDAIFLTVDGFLSEATSANLFLVRRGELATPALACAILPGTTRDWLLAWASPRRPERRTRAG